MSLSPYFQPTDGGDRVFSVESAKIKFGFGALAEIGSDARALKMTRVAVYTDANVAKLEPVSIVMAALKKQGMDPLNLTKVPGPDIVERFVICLIRPGLGAVLNHSAMSPRRFDHPAAFPDRL